MGDMVSFWGFEENNDAEQLGQKLLQTTLELEKLKAEAMEELNSNKEYIKELITLLKLAIQERDDARDQLQKILNNPDKKPANSSITESNSLSDHYNNHCSPPPVEESFFDPLQFSNINFHGQQSNGNVLIGTNHADFPAPEKPDHGSLIIDSIARRRVLPQRGKFLEAVLRSGPMLHTLLMAGPLPQWRNPPQIKPFQIPPMTVKGRQMNFGPCGSSQIQPLHNLQVQNVVGPFLSPANTMNATTTGYGYVPPAKRQRFSSC